MPLTTNNPLISILVGIVIAQNNEMEGLCTDASNKMLECLAMFKYLLMLEDKHKHGSPYQ